MATEIPALKALRRFRARLDSPPLRVIALTALFSAAAVYEGFELRAVSNSDIWWHLRTGLWVLQNHAIPRSGLFSQYASSPWIDSSWAYDVLVGLGYKVSGLRAIPVLLMGFKMALAAVTFSLARGWRGNFWGAVLLSLSAQYAIVDLQPGPETFSILFFAIELGLLLHASRRCDVRPLFWLPLLFVLWANLHVQFLNGLLLVAVFLLAQGVLNRYAVDAPEPRTLPFGKVAGISGLSALATLLTPYGVHLWPDAFKSAYSRVLFESFAEMTPMAFRRPQNFVLLFLAMAAFFVLGRQRSRDFFKLGLVCLSLVLSFRLQRDAWCVVLVAIAVLADFLCSQPSESEAGSKSQLHGWHKVVVSALALTVFAASVARLPGEQALMAKAARVFPVKASDFVRVNQLPAPLFNHYDWGGFLIWYLPNYPVAIDRRVNLYGDEINDRYFRITTGAQRFQSDPNFAAARTILLERKSDMAMALTTLPVLRGKFRVAYQDDIAVILLPQ
jgi:hypothetical protein